MFGVFVRALGAVLLPLRSALIGVVMLAGNAITIASERPVILKWLALLALAATLAAVTALVEF